MNQTTTVPTTYMLTVAQYAPFVGYEPDTRTHVCDCWICGVGARRKTHRNALAAAIKMGIRVQLHQTATSTGYGNRCPACTEK